MEQPGPLSQVARPQGSAGVSQREVRTGLWTKTPPRLRAQAVPGELAAQGEKAAQPEPISHVVRPEGSAGVS